ncbi:MULTISPECIES: hypothetical protein [unclassified Microbacterium]|uniref:hypothetical protein n=1 Tax=unclassified Microbacterium TaxID=2609290 RepID=UPI000CFC6C33|nr:MULTISPECIES: hypothetical protein [unclassified Microbacterium]PQZ56040.1 hypothetical protein CQ032_10650 [Microbacterium sp. MYb43]PQZ78507.1 hypothetical protein CQ031_09920 [Microbacterium sp. MYb40]PRB22616.1 hypothetical protein CQ040_04345 [Microbacterium sp. MYb54]PRB26814.1 hypothetical protein CQ037_13020 [Microbacterium sp. MYb50]PRB68882.1 hypothetical protein CQ021_04510 [Microbacterium sp. MYb24]
MTDESDSSAPRQRVVRVSGSRRARLTPVPGSDPEPESGPADVPPPPARPKGAKGPNDDQLIQDVPPHY